MKKLMFIALCTAFAISTAAQTKRVAYRSHSGSNIAFAMLEDGNLGNPISDYEMTLIRLSYDSVFRADSLQRLKADSLTKKTGKPKTPPQKLKHIPADTLPAQQTPNKSEQKKGPMIDTGKANDGERNGFPTMLLVGLFVPASVAAAFALRQ